LVPNQALEVLDPGRKIGAVDALIANVFFHVGKPIAEGCPEIIGGGSQVAPPE
jgi:hypothetical protein